MAISRLERFEWRVHVLVFSRDWNCRGDCKLEFGTGSSSSVHDEYGEIGLGLGQRRAPRANGKGGKPMSTDMTLCLPLILSTLCVCIIDLSVLISPKESSMCDPYMSI